MPLLGPSTDYTDKDFDALRARLFALIRSAHPDWLEEEVLNVGNLLLEAFAFVGDVLTKYQDNQAGEAFIGRVTQMKNILALCKMLGFKPRGNTASSVDLELRLSAPSEYGVMVPARSRFNTDAVVAPVVFESLAAVYFAPGDVGPHTVTAENAEAREETFTATGLPNQEMRLTARPFLDNSLEVEDNAQPYEVVDDFLDSTSGDAHCTVQVDQDGRAIVRFGNGTTGAIPSGAITVRYKVGGGAAGRVEANKVRRVESQPADESGAVVTLLVNNPEKSSVALNRMTVDEIRVLAPKSIRAPSRTVAREDFEIRAGEVAGVARALMLTAAQEAGIRENSGILFLVPVGGGTPTAEMRAAVLHRVTVEFPCTATFQVAVQGALYKTVDVYSVVHLAPGAPMLAVRARIQLALEALFAIQLPDGSPNPTVDFGFNLRGNEDGGSVAWSDVHDAIRDVQGVRKVDVGPEGLVLNEARADVPLALREFPTLGTITIVNAQTGAPILLDAKVYAAEAKAAKGVKA